jgi:hypothetical protein
VNAHTSEEIPEVPEVTLRVLCSQISEAVGAVVGRLVTDRVVSSQISLVVGAVVGREVTLRVVNSQISLAVGGATERVLELEAQISEAVGTTESPASEAHEKLVIPREAWTQTSDAAMKVVSVREA